MQWSCGLQIHCIVLARSASATVFAQQQPAYASLVLKHCALICQLDSLMKIVHAPGYAALSSQLFSRQAHSGSHDVVPAAAAAAATSPAKAGSQQFVLLCCCLWVPKRSSMMTYGHRRVLQASHGSFCSMQALACGVA